MVCKLTFFGLAFLALTCFNPCYVGLWSVRVSTVFGGFCLACFNPCYVGLWSVRRWKSKTSPKPMRFQSLLCWIMVCKTLKPKPPKYPKRSFNPCYVGLWSVSGQNPYRYRVRGIRRFNPCYVGLWSVRPAHLPIAKNGTSFNPCYVGLWSVRLSITPTATSLICFNPCYVGLWSVRSHNSA